MAYTVTYKDQFMKTETDIHDSIKEYYGRVLAGTKDLKTGACCSPNDLSPSLRAILSDINPEIVERFYGCDAPIPPAIEGKTVLDLGCGTGRDVYLCSKLAGPSGQVIGVDMTEEQLEVARRHVESQTERFGLPAPNVVFLQGYMENLRAMGIKDHSVDVVISNCVINLSPDKDLVFSEIFRVLKPGGELFFSDVFADRRIPSNLARDPVLLGECLAGAMYLEDFRRMLLLQGIRDFRVVKKAPIAIKDDEIENKIGMVNFVSLTIRAFNLTSLEDRCEDYGQVAWYLGTLKDAPHSFVFDEHHEFLTSKPTLVCGNTASMLAETRFAPHFHVMGNRSSHFGLFNCGGDDSRTRENYKVDPGGNCCP